MVRSTPATRGGVRKPGIVNPARRATSHNARAVTAKRTDGAAEIGETDIAESMERGWDTNVGSASLRSKSPLV
jgi:hypothetical protein